MRRAFAGAVWALGLEIDLLAETLGRVRLERALGEPLRGLTPAQRTALLADAASRRSVLAHAIFARLPAEEQVQSLEEPRRRLAADSALVDCTQRRPLSLWRVERDADEERVVATLVDATTGYETTEVFAVTLLDGEEPTEPAFAIAGWCIELRGAAALMGLARLDADRAGGELEQARRAWLSELTGVEL